MTAPLPRLAELVTALSLATDIGVGMPMEMMLSTCLVSVRLGEALRLSDDELREAYYLALMRHAGCTADSPHAAELMGDELDTFRAWISINPTQPLQIMHVMWRDIVDQSKPTLAACRRGGLSPRYLADYGNYLSETA